MRSLLLPLALVATSGCGAIIDTVYHTLDDKQFTQTSEERTPTGQTVTRFEVDALEPGEQGPRLSCYQRTRSIDRKWSATKVYEYRGGYEKSAYMGTAIVDGLFAGVTAGVIAGICLNEDSDTSCMHMLWATPQTLSALYSIYRYATVGAPVLVDKQSSGDHMGLSTTQLEESAVSCEAISQIWLGTTTGADDIDMLNGRDSSTPIEMSEDSIQLAISDTGELLLDQERAERWASSPVASIWARSRDGALHRVRVDRCTVLRPFAATLTGDAQQGYQRDCAPTQTQTGAEQR